MNNLLLRSVKGEDIVQFFEQQLDPVARQMAAFTPADSTDWDAYAERWDRILANENVTARTIVFDGQVAGNIVSFEYLGQREVGYWLGREYWGRGIATAALALFLQEVKDRPLYANVVKDNAASRRVLEKCGFFVTGEKKGFANARGEEVEEVVMKLERSH